jgi:hypothetical protein
MNQVVFSVPGGDSVAVQLFRRGGTLGYNYARGDFSASDGGQASLLPRDGDGQFRFEIGWLGPGRLPDGEYRLETGGGAKVYFRVRWASEAEAEVTVHTNIGLRPAEAFPPAPPVQATAQDPPAQVTHQVTPWLEVVELLEVAQAAIPGTVTIFPEVWNHGWGPGPGTPPGQARPRKRSKIAPRPAGPTLELDGVTRTVAEWAKERGLDPLEIYARLAKGWTIDRALATAAHPAGGRPRGDRAGRAIELE